MFITPVTSSTISNSSKILKVFDICFFLINGIVVEFFKTQAENSYQMYLSNDDKEDIDLEAHI